MGAEVHHLYCGVSNQSGPRVIVPFEWTVKRFSADLSLCCASVICTQLERNNKSNIEKGRTP